MGSEILLFVVVGVVNVDCVLKYGDCIGFGNCWLEVCVMFGYMNGCFSYVLDD